MPRNSWGLPMPVDPKSKRYSWGDPNNQVTPIPLGGWNGGSGGFDPNGPQPWDGRVLGEVKPNPWGNPRSGPFDPNGPGQIPDFPNGPKIPDTTIPMPQPDGRSTLPGEQPREYPRRPSTNQYNEHYIPGYLDAETGKPRFYNPAVATDEASRNAMEQINAMLAMLPYMSNRDMQANIDLIKTMATQIANDDPSMLEYINELSTGIPTWTKWSDPTQYGLRDRLVKAKDAISGALYNADNMDVGPAEQAMVSILNRLIQLTPENGIAGRRAMAAYRDAVETLMASVPEEYQAMFTNLVMPTMNTPSLNTPLGAYAPAIAGQSTSQRSYGWANPRYT